MVDKLVKRAYKARDNWWTAVKAGVNLHGYYYYDIPKNLAYRYPAPGSCALDEVSYPHLFKKHWKTPFRNSPFNIRPKEKVMPLEENATNYVQSIPEFDPETPSGREQLLQFQPNKEHLNLAVEEGMSLDSPEMLQMIWDANESRAENVEYDRHNYNAYTNDIDHDYDQVQFLQRDRDWTGMEPDARMRMI